MLTLTSVTICCLFSRQAGRIDYRLPNGGGGAAVDQCDDSAGGCCLGVSVVSPEKDHKECFMYLDFQLNDTKTKKKTKK